MDLDLDSKFSKWILDSGSIFFHGFGFEIINGFGSFSRWILTWISILSRIGLDFGFHILLGFGLGFQFTNGFKSKSKNPNPHSSTGHHHHCD